MFVLDNSGSIGSANFYEILRFVNEVIDSFNISKEGTHISVVSYASYSNTNFNLTAFYDKAQIKSEVSRIRFTGGGTYTDKGIDDMIGVFSTTGRTTVHPKVGIVLTDGGSSNSAALSVAVQKAHDKNIIMMAVGVGNYNENELGMIASEPKCMHMFMVENFHEIEGLKSAIMQRSCKGKYDFVFHIKYI